MDSTIADLIHERSWTIAECAMKLFDDAIPQRHPLNRFLQLKWIITNSFREVLAAQNDCKCQRHLVERETSNESEFSASSLEPTPALTRTNTTNPSTCI